MNARNKPFLAITAAVALLSAGGAFAQEATHDYDRSPALHSGATRAQVVADTAAFRASGELPSYSLEWSVAPQRFSPTESRAQVNAETVNALKANEVVSDGEVYNASPRGRSA
ncbi:MAG TPA: DUF4148 domain-containing protein [Burkholderiaceae bacterium]|nr:DUF4148 domain-containing protein [Burkholderiaceae bacterium]